jgi:hypothetical protein
MREGVCPECKKKTLWTWKEKPGMVQCNRTNSCNYAETTKSLFPDIFEDLNKKYPATDENPTQTADAYLSMHRGIDPAKITGWYEQGKYWHPRADKGTATVRFYLDADKSIMWERLIDDVSITLDDGEQETRNKNFKGSFKGHWWQPPTLKITPKSTVYFCEGILDAIALNLNGINAVAIMSSGTFPDTAIKPYLHQGITWVLALDNDATGRRCLQKHAKKLREMGEKVDAMLSSDSDSKQDWNDLHKAGKLTAADIKHYRYLGKLELCNSHVEKARAMFHHNPNRTFFIYTHRNSTYSCNVDMEVYKKDLGDDISTEVLLGFEDSADLVFNKAAKLKEIATFRLGFLYFQKPQNGEDGQYFFRFNFSNGAPEIQLAFSGKTFSGAGDFKKSVMQLTPSALFTGTNKDLDYLYREWMGNVPKIVKTLDYVGYDRDTQAYVYADYAVQHGKLLSLNKESFFQLKQGGIKTTVDIKQQLSNKTTANWLTDYQTAYGTKGMTALAFWFGCLFVEQIRNQQRSYPFFEIVGEAGSGKSDMVDFLWKLLGREGESFNPNSSTIAGRTRKMSEVSNLPVVFNETDNEKQSEERHQKQFNWDELKDLFDGEFGRVTGLKSQDNSTRKPTFKAGLMIVQNIPVIASEAIMSRIVHLQFDRGHHSDAGKAASDRLNMLLTTDVSGFLLHSVQQADTVLKNFGLYFSKHRKALQQNDKIKMQRIIENHAKIMAMADCLKLVIPVDDATVAQIHANLERMAETRQESLNDDHIVVQQFWAQFEYMNSLCRSNTDGQDQIEENRINHSTTPDETIAINLEHYRQRCADLKLELQDTKELRRHLITSRKPKYITNEPTWSRLEGRTIRCWIFKRV